LNEALGLLEVTGLTPTLVAIDVMEKTADVRVIQCELNDFYGVSTKIAGPVAAVHAAMAAGRAAAERMGGNPVADVIDRADEEGQKAIFSPKEYNPLIEQDVVFFPNQEKKNCPDFCLNKNGTVPSTAQQKNTTISSTNEEHAMEQENFALGLIETQGFTAVFEAIDTACKTANVQVVCKEKLGGGYITIVIKGELSAVKAAVDAGQAKVDGLGKLIASHVIARPSKSVLSLLPKS
jgi:carbon dioxide concentrating mechanism protein CcmO